MKKFFVGAFFVLSSIINAQTVVFLETFEPPTFADSVTTSNTGGTKLFTLNNRLAASGQYSDSCQVSDNATVYLETNSFSTLGQSYVMLDFDHICKISFFDAAEIFVSVNGGSSWIQLTEAEYQGSGNFSGSKFTANSYPTPWTPIDDAAIPNNTWWKHEVFDISAIAGNKADVKVRFALRDAGATGGNGAAGWFIDNIKITTALSELNPPQITLLPPIYTGTIYQLGPFEVKANITDASGLSSTQIVYTVNGGAPQTVNMILQSGITYVGQIPAVNHGDVVCYYVKAVDASAALNTAQAPSSGCQSFTASAGITFPFIDNFDAQNLWTANPGSLWQLGTPAYGATNSAHSAPNAWDIVLGAAYPANGADTLFSPVFNFSSAVNARMSFWINYNTQANYDGVAMQYTTNGTTWQSLGVVGDSKGSNWFNSTVNGRPAWSGNSNGWTLCEYKLSDLNNATGPVQFRFIFTSNASTQYDGFSIDDFQIILPDPWDIATVSVLEPVDACNIGNAQIKIRVKNNGSNTITNFVAKYSVNGGAAVSENVTQTILPDSFYVYQFTTPFNFQAPTSDVTYNITAWAELSGDVAHANDTAQKSVLSYYVPAVPTVTNANVYYGQQATLTAACDPGYSIRWFNQPTGGNYFHTGTSYTTPPLFATTSYYVSADGSSYFNKTIGTGTLTQYNLPLNAYYDYSWGAMIYTNTEIGGANKIDTIAFYVGNTVTSFTTNNQKIYMTHSPSSSFADASKPDPSTMTEVFSGNITWTGSGWFYIKLQTPFNYNGTDNLLIYWENRDGSYASGYPTFRYTTTTDNKAKYKYQDGSFPNVSGTLTTSRPNIYLSGGIFGCQSPRVPITANIIPYADEANLLEISTPVSTCTNTNENVTIKIKNDGTNDINGNFTATYIVNNGTPVTENITALIPSGTTYDYTFATPIDPQLSGSNMSTTLNITAYVKLQGDIYPNNDTLRKTVTLNWKPNPPVASNVTINYGNTATLTASSPYTINWFNQAVGGSQIGTGTTYVTPILYDTTSYWVEANTMSYSQKTIGTGTSTQSYIPVYGTYNYGWSASLYDKTEIGSSMKIDTISWYVGSTTNNYLMNRIRVFLGHTSLSVFANGNRPDTTSLVLVYSGDINWNGPGWFNLKLQNSFNYNGTDNLIVYCENWDGSWTTGAPSFRYTATTGNKAIYKYQDASFLYTAGTTTTNRPNIRFSGGTIGCPSDRTEVVAIVENIPQYDAGAISIVTPNSGIELSNAEPVKIKIKNYGILPLTSIDASYVINNGTPVTETITTNLNSGDTLEYTFTQTANLSTIGTYNIKAYTTVAGDNATINDTAYKTVVCSPLTYCTSNATSTADDDIGNVTLANLNNGIATPVLNNPTANKTYSDFTNLPPIYLFSGSSYPISVSAIWSGSFYSCFVAAFIDFNRDGVFDTLTERILGAGITSSSANTVTNTFTVPVTAVKNKLLRMRVVLRENGSITSTLPCGTYTYGETEDYNVMILERIPNDASLVEFVSPVSGCGHTATEQVKVRIKNFGTNALTSCNVTYILNNGTPVTETFTGNLPTDASTVFTFAQTVDMSNPGNYTFKAYTTLAGDSSNMNDTVSNYLVKSGWNLMLAPYTMGFEPTENFSDWSIIDANADNTKWGLSTTGGNLGPYCLKYGFNSTNAADDWAVSRCFDFKANDVYRIKFSYKTGSTSFTEKLKFAIANAANPTNFSVIKDFGTIQTTTYITFDTTFTVPTNGTYYLGWHAYSAANQSGIFLDDINLSVLPQQEIGAVEISAPTTGCNVGVAQIKLKMKNNGSQPINGNLTAYYSVNNSTPVNEPITATILPDATYIHTFSTPYDFSVTTSDVTFNIKAWVKLTGDPIATNDTTNNAIVSYHIPTNPVTINDTVNYGEQATLIAQSPDYTVWYAQSTGGNIITINDTLITPPLFDTTTYWVEANTITFKSIIIGTGTSASNSAPTNGYFNYSWSASIYEQTNIGFAGFIDTIGYYINNTVNNFLMNNQKIYMAHTSDVVFVNGNKPDPASMTLVYDGNITWNGTGWYKIKLQNSFQYNGADNLLIYWENRDGSYVSSGYPSFRYTNTTGNKTKYASSDASFPTAAGTLTTNRPNLYISGTSFGCSSNRVPATAFVNIPAIELEAVSIVQPTSSCVNGFVPVTMRIKNNGTSTATSIIASYSVNNGAANNENISQSIAAGDSLDFTFTAQIDPQLSVLNTDTALTIKAWISHNSDLYHVNNTTMASVILSYMPDAPIADNDTIPYGTSANLAVIADTGLIVNWYVTPSSSTIINTGLTYTTPILYDTTTYYVSVKNGSPDLKITEVTLYKTGTGATSPYPAWCSGQDLIEITNLGTASQNLLNYTFSIFGTGARTFTLPDIEIGPGQILILHAGTGTDDFTNRYLNMGGTNDAILSSSLSGFVLKSPTGVIVDAVAVNGYAFDGSSGVTAQDWSGNIASSSGLAGVIRTVSDNNTASDWIVSSASTPQTIGALNPTLSSGSGGGQACESQRIPVTAYVTNIPSKDAGVIAILAPNNGVELSNAEPVKVTIKNFGTDPITSLQVSFQIGNNTPVSETLTATINPGDTYDYTFTQTANLSIPATYQIKAYTTLNGDNYYQNDTAYKSVTCSPLTYCDSYATSPASYEDIGNVTISNLNNGIATPTNNNPTAVNGYSDFTQSLPPVYLVRGQTYDISLSQISASSQFASLFNVYIDYNRNGQFDLPEEKVFSAPTTTTLLTVTGQITVPMTAVTGRLTRMRVVLDESDVAPPCGTYTWGETEDYSVMIMDRIPQDAALISVSSPRSGCSLTNNEIVSVVLKNFGSQPITSCDISYSVNGNTVTETYTGTLLPDSSTTFDFTTPVDLSAQGAYTFNFYTTLAGDSNTFNDAINNYTVTNGWDFVAGAYTMGFEPTENFAAWTILDQNNDGKTWSVMPTGGNTSPYCLRYTYSVNNPADDIAVSPCFKLQPNTIYRVSFAYKTYTDPEKLKFGFVDPNVPNSFTVIKDFGTINNQTYQTFDTTFTVQTAGIYYFGWYAYSDINQYYIYLDDINIRVHAWPNDAALIEILKPSSPVVEANSQNYVKVVLKNFGANTLNFIPLRIDVNGNNVVSDTWIGALLPGDTTSYQIAFPFTAPLGNFNICAYTAIPTDPIAANNRSCINLIGLPTKTLAYTDKFDATQDWFTSDTTVWQLGTPSASIINSAYSAPNSWATVLNGNYPNNRQAYLYSPFIDFTNSPDNMVLSFRHWYETQPDFDGGRIEYSTDKGETWTLLGSVGDPLAINWYNTNTNPNMWSGSSAGWILSEDTLSVVNGFDGKVVFRFAFTSNATVNNNGWAIDNVNIRFPQAAVDAEMQEIVTPALSVPMGTSQNVAVRIKNVGFGVLNTFNVSYKINNQPTVTETWTGTLNPGDSMIYTFNTTYTSPLTAFNICAAVTAQGDPYSFNDSICKNVSVTTPPYDAGICAITTPANQSVQGAFIKPTVWIKNYGTQTLTSVPVKYSVNSGAPTSETWTGTLNPGDSVSYTFTASYVSPNGMYGLCAATQLANDVITTNDTLCKTVTGIQGTKDMGVVAITLPSGNVDYNSSQSVTVRIKNFGTSTITSCNVLYKAGNATPVSQTWTGTLAGGDSTTFSFTTPFSVTGAPNSSFTLCAWTALTGDINTSNDSTCKAITVNKLPWDAGVTKIVAPVAYSPAQQPVYVTITLKNFGQNTITSMPVSYTVNGTPTNETWTGTLASGDSVNYTFNQTFNSPPNGITYTLCGITNLANDGFAANNSVCATVLSTVGIDEVEVYGFSLSQNNPNPAKSETEILYSIPTAGQVEFTLTDVLGRVLYSVSEAKAAGNHTLKLNIASFSPGVYFYTMNYNGHSITKRMIIE